MELTRKESLNPEFVHRISRIQTAQMCRFCLNGSDSTLINILDNEHVQMLMAECYHGCLGTLNGNASRFVCTVCYQRLEQSYEFLFMASKVQAQVDTYTFHDGAWPQQSLLKEPSNNNLVRKAEKRVASPGQECMHSKKVRFEESEEDDDQHFGGTSSKVRERCPTPGPFERTTAVAPDASGSSLDTTLSGEIPGTELVRFSESSSLGSDPSPASDAKRRRTRMQAANAKKRSTLGEVGKDLSVVQSLCKRIEAIGVGKVRRGGRVSRAVSRLESKI